VKPIVLSIAGSDPSAGAGLQADLKAIAANGGYAATVVTAITAQNTREVRRVARLAAELVRDQLDAVFSDLKVAAVKSGMLGSADVVREVVRALRKFRPAHYVCDPVLFAGSGVRLLDRQGLAALRRELLPLATLVTPNVDEAEALSGEKIEDLDQAGRAAESLLADGAQAVLVKGGHLRGAPAADLLVTAASRQVFAADFIDTPHTHGTGCIYASAIATGLARGLSLTRAIEMAKKFVTGAIRHGVAIGGGSGPADPLYAMQQPEDGRPRAEFTRAGGGL